MPPLHRDAFVMDGHTHVMTRELLLGTDIGQRYHDGNVDLPRAKEGGVDAMFFSVYTPENYYPGRFEIKNTFRVVQLALDQIKKNEQRHRPGPECLGHRPDQQERKDRGLPGSRRRL